MRNEQIRSILGAYTDRRGYAQWPSSLVYAANGYNVLVIIYANLYIFGKLIYAQPSICDMYSNIILT